MSRFRSAHEKKKNQVLAAVCQSISQLSFQTSHELLSPRTFFYSVLISVYVFALKILLHRETSCYLHRYIS